jgi:hypothetical protein
MRRDRFQHATVRELGDPGIDRIVEPDSAIFDQNHRGNRGDRFGQRRDAKDRVARHRRRIAHGRRAKRLDVKVVVAADERDESGRVAAFHVSRQNSMHEVEPRLCETCSTHVQILTPVEWRRPFRLTFVVW